MKIVINGVITNLPHASRFSLNNDLDTHVMSITVMDVREATLFFSEIPLGAQFKYDANTRTGEITCSKS